MNQTCGGVTSTSGRFDGPRPRRPSAREGRFQVTLINERLETADSRLTLD
jgi:hypothetical protein